MLGRSLAALAALLALGACGGRTTLRVFDDGSPEDASQAGAAGPFAGMGGRSGDGAGAGSSGNGGSGMGGRGGDSSAGNGSAGMSAGSSGAGVGGAGVGGAGGAGGRAGFGGAAGFPAGQGGVGGMVGAGEGGGVAGMGGDILNPHGCATPHPFVLSIDPSGSSGSIRGWLESAAGLVFEDQLPRFVRSFNPETPVAGEVLALWWSIGSVGSNGQGALYFYAESYTNTFTEVAIANGASRFVDIDFAALDFGSETVDAQTGTILVFRNTLTGDALGLRVDQIFITDVDGDALCAAVDASWRFLR
jgi:hypothetical protein